MTKQISKDYYGTRCHYCHATFGIFEVSYEVRKAIKPPNAPYRYEVVGRCCDECAMHKDLTIDRWRDE